TGFKVWPTRFARLGVGICWDQWFPETARVMALRGAELLMFPTAIGTEPPPALPVNSREHWQRTQQGHAAANLTPLIASNRYGLERSLQDPEGLYIRFYGSSSLPTPWARRSTKRPRRATRCSPTPSTSQRPRSCATTGSCSATGGRTSTGRSPHSTDGGRTEEGRGWGSVEAAKQREELGGTAAHLRLETRMMAGIAGAPGRPQFRWRLVDDDLPAAVEGELHPIARPHSQRLADLP